MKRKKELKIGNYFINEDSSVFVVAELSANHNKDFKLAERTIRAAKKAGADAIKLQTYTPDTITLNCDNEYFKIKHNTLWDNKTLYQLYEEAYTPWEWQPKLKEIAEEVGLICFSSPFDKSAVDFLEKMNVPAYKVASFEITDLPLIEYIASKDKPIILSTGMAKKSDVKSALQVCNKMKNNQIILLKCTSAYPAPIEEANLRVIPKMRKIFNSIIGISDHTLGISVSVASVVYGAKVIEKHFILDRSIGGPDASFSMQPEEFKYMVDSIREVEKAMGYSDYALSKNAEKSKIFTRSLFIVKDVEKGEQLTEDSVRSIRPGYGLHPKFFKKVIGKKARKKIQRGTPLSWDLIH